MQREQKVWEHEVIMGALRKSLHTWHLRPESRGDNEESGVVSQSVESEISAPDFIAGWRISIDRWVRPEREERWRSACNRVFGDKTRRDHAFYLS